MPARKNLAKRTPSGRYSRALEHAIDAHSPAQAKRLRDAALRSMAASEWSSELGRLFLADKLTPQRFEAGKRWANLREQFAKTLGIPISPASTLGPRLAVAASSVVRDAFERAIIDAMNDAYQALKAAGPEATMAVISCCEYDRVPAGLDAHKHLHLGLDALAAHWGLT